MIMLLLPRLAYADPLDYEGYVKKSPDEFWMSNGDFFWLLADYGVFALSLVALGWLFYVKPSYGERIETIVCYPFTLLNGIARKNGGWDKLSGILLYVINGCLIFVCLAAWVFFCQWLKQAGFSAISMAGIALVAVVLVRSLGDRRAHS
ncbi:MAG: hypothetical protein R8K53_05060 [Mariprofundaceae bacterium]